MLSRSDKIILTNFLVSIIMFYIIIIPYFFSYDLSTFIGHDFLSNLSSVISPINEAYSKCPLPTADAVVKEVVTNIATTTQTVEVPSIEEVANAMKQQAKNKQVSNNPNTVTVKLVKWIIVFFVSFLTIDYLHPGNLEATGIASLSIASFDMVITEDNIAYVAKKVADIDIDETPIKFTLDQLKAPGEPFVPSRDENYEKPLPKDYRTPGDILMGRNKKK